MKTAKFEFVCLGLLCLALLSACNQPEYSNRQYAGETMGTYFTVKWRDPRPESEVRNLGAEIENLLDGINSSMSTYLYDSELSRLNRRAVGHELLVSDELWEVISQAQEISAQTEGAFDFTVGPLVNLWGFGPGEERSVPPDQSEIEAAKVNMGYQYLEFNKETSTLTRLRDVKIDLSAIAKGYAVDEIARLLKSQGIEHYLVDIGGEVRAGGEKVAKTPWRVGIELPDGGQQGIDRAIKLSDRAVATSGDYRNYFEEWGVRYSHTIDPATGSPVRHSLASVTVVMPRCITADALATALMVMGPGKGRAFAETNRIPAYFIVKENRGYTRFWTDTFSDYLVLE